MARRKRHWSDEACLSGGQQARLDMARRSRSNAAREAYWLGRRRKFFEEVMYGCKMVRFDDATFARHAKLVAIMVRAGMITHETEFFPRPLRERYGFSPAGQFRHVLRMVDLRQPARMARMLQLDAEPYI